MFSLSDSYQLTIDPNTVYKWIQLSDSNREVMRLNAQQPYPDHPERFDRPQLLCTDGLTGPCYWEVEWSGYVSIAVSYKGIKRRGHSDDCLFGLNSQSWSLDCSYSYSVLHNNTETFIPKDVVSNRVAVYVDHPAGTLSFYNIFLDSLIHLHTFNTSHSLNLFILAVESGTIHVVPQCICVLCRWKNLLLLEKLCNCRYTDSLMKDAFL